MAIWIYESEAGKDDVYFRARNAAMALLPSVVTLLAIFFLSIERKYLPTFVSLMRGKDLSINRFRESDEDEHKASVIFKNQGAIGNRLKKKFEAGLGLSGALGKKRSQSG